MIKKEFITTHFTKITFFVAVIFFIGAVSIFAFAKTPLIKKITSETVVKHLFLTPTAVPTSVLGVSKDIIVSTATPTQTPQQLTNVNSVQVTPTPTPVTQQQTQQTGVSVQISEPDGKFNFSLSVGGNACDELTQAKNEGKIKSLTLSDQWMSSTGSLYVKEMNGYVNGWQFTVNGVGPAGCSLSSPKAGDSVIWRFS